MSLFQTTDPDKAYNSLARLVQVIQKDPVIRKKVIKMLKLDSYKRRTVLNNWLEQLRQQQASPKLLSALSCMFDDTIAEEVLSIVNKRFT